HRAAAGTSVEEPAGISRHSPRTIDVSGDGTQNVGRAVIDALDEALAKGITINCLVILTEQRAVVYGGIPLTPIRRVTLTRITSTTQQRDRRPRSLRDGGGEFQLARRDNPQQIERGDRPEGNQVDIGAKDAGAMPKQTA